MWQTSQEPSKSNEYRHATEYNISFFLTHTHELQQGGQVIIFKAYVQIECKKQRTDRRTRWAHVETGSSDKSERTDKQEVMAVTSNFRGHSDAIGLCHEALKHTHTHVHTHTEAQQYSGLNINHRGWQVICRGAPSFSLSFSFLSFLLSPLLLSLCSLSPSLSPSLSLAVCVNCQWDCKVKDRFLPSLSPCLILSLPSPSLHPSLPWSLPCDDHFYHSQSQPSFHRFPAITLPSPIVSPSPIQSIHPSVSSVPPSVSLPSRHYCSGCVALTPDMGY